MNLKYLNIKLIYFSINVITPLAIHIYILLIDIISLIKRLNFKILLNNFLVNNLHYVFLKTNTVRYTFMSIMINIKYMYTIIITNLLCFLVTLKLKSVRIINKNKSFIKKFYFYKPKINKINKNFFINFIYLNRCVLNLFLLLQIFISFLLLLGGFLYLIELGELFVQLAEISLKALISVFIEIIFFAINAVVFFSNFFFEKTLLFTTYSVRIVAFFLNLFWLSEYIFFLFEFVAALQTWSLSLSWLLSAPLTFSNEWHLFVSRDIFGFDSFSILFRRELWWDFLKSDVLFGWTYIISCLHNMVVTLSMLVGLWGYIFFLICSGAISGIPVLASIPVDFVVVELGFGFTVWWFNISEIVLLFGECLVTGCRFVFFGLSSYYEFLNITVALYGAGVGLLSCFFTDLICAAAGTADFVRGWGFLVFFYKLVFGLVFSQVMCVCTWLAGVCTFVASEFCLSFVCFGSVVAWLETLFTGFTFLLDFFIFSGDFYLGNTAILLNFFKICYFVSDFCAGYLGFEPGAVFTYYYLLILIFFGWLANVGRLLFLTTFQCASLPLIHRLSFVRGGNLRYEALTTLSVAARELFGYRQSSVGYRTRRDTMLFAARFRIFPQYIDWLFVRLILRQGGGLYGVNRVDEFLRRARFLKNFYCFNSAWLRHITYRFLKYLAWYKIRAMLVTSQEATIYPKDMAFFSRLSVLGSLPLFSGVCFNDNFFWIGSGGSALSTARSGLGFNLAHTVTFLPDVTFNSRFLRELGLTQLRFTEHGGWGANALVGKYLKMVDTLGLSQLDRGGLEYKRPEIFFASTSELSLLNFQFVCHNIFVSLFFDIFSFSVGNVADGAVSDVSRNSVEFSLLFSVHRFLDSIVPVSAVTAVLTLALMPLSVFFVELAGFIFAVSEFETIFNRPDLGRLELTRLQNSIFFLKHLIGGVTFIKEDKFLALAQRRMDNQIWGSNSFFAWRWLYLFRRQYRLLSGVYDYSRILRGDIPRQVRYAANAYEPFELLPEFFYPLGVFADSAALSSNFGFTSRLGLTSFRVDSVPSLHAFSLKTGRAAARTLFLSNNVHGGLQFNLPEFQYRKLHLEFSGKRLLRRYNYFFSELNGLSELIEELPAVGRWGVDSSLYDKFSKHFASNYWGKKQAFSLKFLEYEKYQYLKKLKRDFLGSAHGYLIQLQRKIHLARDSTLKYIDSTRRDRLVHQLTFFFLTIYDEFLSVTDTSESKYGSVQFAWLRQVRPLLYGELLEAGLVSAGRLSPLFFYVGSTLQYLLFLFVHFFLKLCSFFSHLGALPYLPLSHVTRQRILELSVFSEFGEVAPVKLFRLYVLRTNTILFVSKGSFGELGVVLPLERTYTKV